MSATSQRRPAAKPALRPASLALRGRVIAGVALGALLIGGAGGWAATAQLAGAVVAQGVVAVDQEVKAVQHRDGGIIRSIAVREGDAVTEGQVLISLDDAATRAELSIIRSQLMELSIRRARLQAERDGEPSFALPAGIDAAHATAAAVMTGETRLFDGQHTSRESRKQQIELTIRQIGEEIGGLRAQRDSKSEEIGLVEVEYGRIGQLLASGLTDRGRIHGIERDLARLRGELGEIDAGIARAETRIGELRLQVIAIDDDSRTEAQRELREVETRIAELVERETATADLLLRTDIRAPIAGVVNEVNIHTLGGVVSPAEVLVTIVPNDAELAVAVQVLPAMIDQVNEGQTARMRFTAFNQRITPEILGDVRRVGAATTRDPATGQPFYLAEIALKPEELAKLPDERLLPGMPVEVYIQTETRTALSYFARPITDQFSRAFRER
ncbi:HlyD family type I secretion periplasmic adaptor subunit [Paracoccus sp. S-4012]|uniref:HlyD family type I secretion periplasmic adaptor subunit n=1 Tax=Paracoccus sp. S-4012 TaxID=2665648 RepID=UPI0012AFD999|nr:HlyD family type I secretion periplasmic adaptor subunit [Paracoccus sp. S-4012]MRX52269.1 HlyD family type I secretion periplasmic adaptor subunit [Paracoccus sp. S-4012]